MWSLLGIVLGAGSNAFSSRGFLKDFVFFDGLLGILASFRIQQAD